MKCNFIYYFNLYRYNFYSVLLYQFYYIAFQDIAKILNVTQVAYSCYEIGRRQIPIEALIKLALFYNTSVDYLLGLTDERKPYPKSILSKK